MKVFGVVFSEPERPRCQVRFFESSEIERGEIAIHNQESDPDPSSARERM